jgi:hypothetical protein
MNAFPINGEGFYAEVKQGDHCLRLFSEVSPEGPLSRL